MWQKQEDKTADYSTGCIEYHVIDIGSALERNLNDFNEYGDEWTVQDRFFDIGIKKIGKDDSDRDEYAYISDDIE